MLSLRRGNIWCGFGDGCDVGDEGGVIVVVAGVKVVGGRENVAGKWWRRIFREKEEMRLDQIGKLDLEELDIKWQMAMLSVRINRFEKKAGRKMKFNNRDAARFDKKKVRCYKCSQLGHFAKECTDHEESADDNASQVYGMIAGCDDEDEVAGEFALMGVTSQVQTCPFGCHDKNAELQKEFDDLEAQYKEYYIQVQAYKSTLKTLEQQKAWYQSNQLAYEEKIKVLERDLENTTNLLKYSENVNNNVNLEKQELQTKLDNALARFAKWKETSKNLAKLVDSSMSVKTKLGLGYGDYIGEDEVYYPTMPSIFDPTPEEVDGNPTPVRFVKEGEMNAVPPPITGKFMPTSIHSDFDESQMTYGKKSNDLPETDSNNFVSCASSDKPSDPKTNDFASCDSSDKSSPKSGDSSVFSDSAAESESTSKTAVQEDISFNNTPTVSCNKDGLRHYVKKKSSGFKSCFVCGSYSHLIKDCDFYENRMGVYSGHRESRPMWKNVDNIPPFVPQAAHGRSGKVTFPAGRVKVPAPIPTGRQTGPAPVYAGTPVPADGQNRPTPVHAGRPFPAGRRNSVSVSAGWRRSAARPMFRPTSSHFQNSSRPVYYNEMYMGGGRWETAVKTSTGCSWKDRRPNLQWGSKNNGGSHQSTWCGCGDGCDVGDEGGVIVVVAGVKVVGGRENVAGKWWRRIFREREEMRLDVTDQIGKLDLEELDIKWQMAMLSVRINRFEKKDGRKMKFNNRDAARFDKKKVRCYKCSQLGHFSRECTGKQLESNARYSAFKLKEMEQDKPADPKALLSVDSMVNWSDHEESADENASQVYGMIAGRDDEVAGEFALMGVTSQVQTCPFGCHDKYAELKKEFDDLEVQYKEYYIQVQAYKNTLKTLEQQKAWYQSNQLAYEEKVKVLKRDLENTTNLLKYSESINNNVNLEKQELQTKLDNTLARFAKWKESSKNLATLVDSSMTVKTKLGLGYGDYIGEDEIYYPTMPSIFDTTPEDVDGNSNPVRFVKEGAMNAVPPPITGTFMPTSIHSDFDESQMTYGKNSNDQSETDSNDFVSCASSDKSSEPKTNDFASCDSSDKSSSPKSVESSVFSPRVAESESNLKTAAQEDISFNNNTPSVSSVKDDKHSSFGCNKNGLRHK
ncbi:putative ribonuclease H-like domain-containing protein [Tanacetum coccineum]|uniref:Ribonuclease H-like domain-containing protein n=1 Tax=Tanacetum coccineum TaxID=301880 RepID=A0ABQ4ZH42_9ASTR